MNTSEEVAQQYYHIIKSYFQQRVSDQQDAFDLTQDVFVKIIRSGKELDQIHNLPSWIMTISHNQLVDFYRKKRPLLVDEHSEIPVMEDSEDEIYASLEKCLAPLLALLRDEDRYLIQKVDFEKVSQKDLAAQFNWPEPTLRSKVQRARKKLYRHFTDMCSFEYDNLGNPQDCELKKKCNC